MADEVSKADANQTRTMIGIDPSTGEIRIFRVSTTGVLADTELPPAALVPAGGAANIAAPQVNAMLMALSGTNVFPVPIINPSADDNPTAGGLAVTSQLLMFDGFNWDRARGDSVNGLLVNSELPAAAALSDATANPTAPMVGSALMGWNTSNWARLTASVTADATATGLTTLWTSSQEQNFNGSTWDRKRTPNVFKVVSLGAGTAETTIWTPAGGKKFRLMGYILTSGAASTLTFKDNTGGTTIWASRGATDTPQSPNGIGNGILSAAANNVLTVTRGTSSTLDGVVFGTEE